MRALLIAKEINQIINNHLERKTNEEGNKFNRYFPTDFVTEKDFEDEEMLIEMEVLFKKMFKGVSNGKKSTSAK